MTANPQNQRGVAWGLGGRDLGCCLSRAGPYLAVSLELLSLHPATRCLSELAPTCRERALSLMCLPLELFLAPPHPSLACYREVVHILAEKKGSDKMFGIVFTCKELSAKVKHQGKKMLWLNWCFSRILGTTVWFAQCPTTLSAKVLVCKTEGTSLGDPVPFGHDD